MKEKTIDQQIDDKFLKLKEVLNSDLSKLKVDFLKVDLTKTQILVLQELQNETRN